MQDWLKKHQKAYNEVFHVQFRLRSLAQAFEMTGNDVMREELRDIASIVVKCTKEMNHAVAQSINKSLKETQKNT